MKISMIAAMTPELAIGKDNQLLWHLPADLKFFKQTTLGKPVIMGRKTFDSIGRPLPGRTNIVLSTKTEKPHPNVELAHTIEQALTLAGDVEEVMIIGGSQIYQLFLSQTDRLYLTEVDTKVQDADAFFPEFDKSDWTIVTSVAGTVDEKNPLPHLFITLDRK